MKRKRRGARFAAAIVAGGLLAGSAQAELLDASLTRAQLREHFTTLRTAGTRIDAPLEWQFVFTGADSHALEALSVKLVSAGYRIVSLHPGERGSALRVARTELLTPATLERRQRELREITRGHVGTVYEGAEPLAAR